MDTLTQVERLIELAIIQRSELRRLVEELPQLKAHLSEEIERTFEETEPQLRAELEEWTTKQTADKTAALGVALEAKIADLAKSLEVSTQARYNAIIAERGENARLAAQAEAKIAEHAASLPGAVKEIVSAELARFPRAGEIDQLRKEFAEPKSLNPRGKWQAGETYNKLDLVTINGDSYVSNIDGNSEKPSRSAANWTLNAARGISGGGGGITSLNDILGNPSTGDIVGSEGNNYVRKTLTAGDGIGITETPTTITIDASAAQQKLTATVKNAESFAITRGQVVYLFGATGNIASVKLASNTSDATSAKTFGVVSDASIAANGTGIITCVGVQDKLTLGAYNEGDTLYLGATAGSVTNVKPYAPNHLVYVGIVERANNGNGELYVKVQNGYELDEIHDVQINAPKLAGQTLIYDATTDLWKNARLTAGVGVSILNADSSITISADGGVNYQGTWNASTNTPTLTSSVGTKGFYYVVSVAGSTNLNGVTDWKVGDWAIFNGTAWEKVDTTDQVSSVFGRTGAVVGVSTDYSSVGITNTAIGASNPSTGAFTTLSASSTLDAIGNATVGTASGGITGKLTIGNGVAGNSAVVLRGGSTQLAWQVGSNINNANSLELSPSTANGGTTFSSTVWRVDNSGNSTQSGNLTVSGTGPHTFSGRLNITNTSGNVSLVQGAGAAGSNYGLRVQAGLNVSDYGLFVTDSTSTSGYFIVRGDGSAKAFNGFEVGGNLTVSGGTITGGASGLSLASGGTNQNITLTPSGTGEVVVAKPTASGTRTFVTISETGTAADSAQQILFKNTQYSWDQGALRSVRSGANSNFHLDFIPSTAGALNAASASARLTSTGNFLIGATADGGQKLQVSGTAAIRDSVLVAATSDPTNYYFKASANYNYGKAFSLEVRGGGASIGDIFTWADAAGLTLNSLTGSNLTLKTSNATALTLDSSQNATFEKTVGSALGFRGTKSVVVSSDTTVEIAADSGLGGIYQITVSGSNRVQRVLVSVAAQQYDNAKISVLSNYTYGGQAVLSNFRVTSNAGNTVRALICDVGNRNGASVTVSASAMFDTNGLLTLVSPSTYTTAVTTVYPMSVAAGPSASDLTLGGDLTVSGTGTSSFASGSLLKIGLPTNAPNKNLGGNLLQVKSAGGIAYITIGNGDGANNTSYIGGASSYLLFGKVSDAGSTTEFARFIDSGNFLIGKTTPDTGQKLQVSGRISAVDSTGSAIIAANQAGATFTSNSAALELNADNPNTGANNRAVGIYRTGDTVYRLLVTMDGGMAWSSGSALQDISLYRAGAGALYSNASGSTNLLGLAISGTRKSLWYFDGTDTLLGADTGSLKLVSNGTTFLTGDSSQNATFAGTVTATVNKSAANYTTVTTYVAAGSTTTTVHTFANANTNRSWMVSTRQQGSASNTVIGFATTYGGTLVVYRIAQSNTTGGVLDMNFTASGLNLQLVLGSGFGSTTWDTTITPIQG